MGFTPEQRRNISEAMKRHHARRTEEQKAETRLKQSDAALCRIWTPMRPSSRFKKGHANMTTPQDIARREMNRVQSASVRRILADIARNDPELIKDAIVSGLLADPPRSFPYIALAAAYLDGKPTEARPLPSSLPDLSHLNREELMRRALDIATTLRDLEVAKASRPVVDGEVIE